ncbi:endonuclease YncB(thermonuclease family) [Nicoletella semolina]|uniref:Endonuclease YncB(Thermonuclease family) n=1 Tax=Nicoletella semolina TaxID=271160 RepID=A0A4R2N796_9PAST|nr:hypothetical protein [Nicoletella semolina]TCP16802.1 endonuclease YncB(thermonuclease family) [Nicoletella semolina]
MYKSIHKFFVGFFSLFFVGFVYSKPHLDVFYCKVIHISDGDSLTCLINNSPTKVRLQYIDAPELDQPYGESSKRGLAELVLNKQVKLLVSGRDRYNRLLAEVYDKRRGNINLKMVEMGLVWVYSYTKPIYSQAEQRAKRNHLGLWQDKNPINPKQWRENKRSDLPKNLQNKNVKKSNVQRKSEYSPLVSSQSVPLLDCRKKRSCRQLKTYENALAYFQQCGWKELDRNGDGIPCNTLYRQANRLKGSRYD